MPMPPAERLSVRMAESRAFAPDLVRQAQHLEATVSSLEHEVEDLKRQLEEAKTHAADRTS